MEKPRDDTPPADYLPRSAFTTSAVAADEEVAGREAPFRRPMTTSREASAPSRTNASRSRSARPSSSSRTPPSTA